MCCFLSTPSQRLEVITKARASEFGTLLLAKMTAPLHCLFRTRSFHCGFSVVKPLIYALQVQGLHAIRNTKKVVVQTYECQFPRMSWKKRFQTITLCFSRFTFGGSFILQFLNEFLQQKSSNELPQRTPSKLKFSVHARRSKLQHGLWFQVPSSMLQSSSFVCFKYVIYFFEQVYVEWMES